MEGTKLMRKQTRSFLIALILISGVSLPAFSQTQTGRIWGTVTDSSGAVVPGATVTATNSGTGLAKTFATDERGRFVFTDLHPGEYQISTEVPGFKRFVRTGIVLHVTDGVEIPIRLELGALTEEVSVTAQTPLLNTATSALGEVVENKMITELPLNGRQTLSLVMLVPGVAPNRMMNDPTSPFNMRNNFSIGGARGDTNELLLDGAPNTLPEGSTGAMTAVAVFPSVDSTQEFKVQSNAYSAEYGRTGGGVINIVTKSGTNAFHGTVYEFLRNSVLDSNNFFNNMNHVPLASFKRNQFGGTIGGPMRIPGVYNGKNRTFFFFSWESLLERGGSTYSYSVPTLLERAGDFTQTFDATGKPVTIYDPATTAFNPTTKTYTRVPFSGNKIPQSRMDPIALKVLSFYPEPNAAGQAFTHAQNFIKSPTVPLDEHKYDVRIDHQISPKQSFFGRFSFGNYTYTIPNIYGNIADEWSSRWPSNYRSVSFGSVYSFGPKYLVDLKYSYNYLYFGQEPESRGYNLTQLGLPQYLYDNSQVHIFPRFTFSGYGAFGFSQNTQWGRQESHSGLMSLSRISGNHVTKIGGDIRMNRASRFANSRGSSGYAFARDFTQGPNPLVASTSAGNAIASALLGAVSSGTINIAKNPATQNWYDGIYIQDDWRITQKLTLNLGLRYDLEWPFTERFNNISWFDNTLPSPIAAQVPSLNFGGAVTFATPEKRTPWEVKTKNFAPRVGLAYQITEGTVIRSGYGIFYVPNVYGTSDNTGSGFSQSTAMLTTIDSVTPIGKLSDPFPSGFIPVLGPKGGPGTNIGSSMSWFDRKAAPPYVQQWNLNIQRRIGSTLVVDVAYSGTKGTHIPDRGFALNQIQPSQMGPETILSVDNPFYGVITTPGSILAAPKIVKRQLMATYPQYTSNSLTYPLAASSIYHALQLKLIQRFSKNASFLISYTKGKNIDDSSGLMTWLEPASAHQNVYNRRADRSISDQDIAQRFVASFNLVLPFGRDGRYGRGWSPVVNGFLGGWQINGILSFQSGIPLSLTTTNSSYSNNSVLRPNNNGTSAKLDNPTISQWFDRAVFSQPPNFSFGNVGRNLPDVRGPGQRNLDFSLFKNIKFAETRYIQFRSEVFNLTNTPEFDNPDTSLQSSTFGRILSQRNRPRQIQFGLKIIF